MELATTERRPPVYTPVARYRVGSCATCHQHVLSPTLAACPSCRTATVTACSVDVLTLGQAVAFIARHDHEAFSPCVNCDGFGLYPEHRHLDHDADPLCCACAGWSCRP